jgi:hypothetical protein
MIGATTAEVGKDLRTQDEAGWKDTQEVGKDLRTQDKAGWKDTQA